jgi:PmbA protein
MQLATPVSYVALSAPINVPELTELHNSALTNVDIERKMKLAQTLEEVALKFDKRITAVPYNGYRENDLRTVYFNSREFFGGYESNGCGAYLYPLAKEGEDAQMGSESYYTRDFDSIKPIELAEKAAQKALSRLGAVVPASQKVPVLLRNDVAQTYFDLFAQMFSGQSVYDSTSPLKNKLGQKLTPDFWTLTDDPYYHGAFHSRPIDGEGQISKVTTLVADGEIKNFLTDQRSAHLLGRPNTASSGRSPYTSFAVTPSNVVITAKKTISQKDLLKLHTEIVMITNLKGLSGYNSVNGDFSIESEGELYRNGERVCALKNFLVTGNLLDSLAQIEAFGDDVRMDSSNVITPSVLISSMNIAGK